MQSSLQSKQAQDAAAARPLINPTDGQVLRGKLGRYLLGGALVGGGLASVTGLVSLLNEAKRHRDMAKQDKEETDASTLIMTLPPKRAGEAAPPSENVATDDTETLMARVKHLEPLLRESKLADAKGRKHDHVDGQYTKQAQGNWHNPVMAGTAAVIGAPLAYMGVRSMIEKWREREARIQLERARQEYLDKLQARALELDKQGAFDNPAGENHGDNRYQLHRMADSVLGLGGLLLLLGTAGSAYLTKRYLDDDDITTRVADIPQLPKIRSVVFRSAPATAAQLEAKAKDDASKLTAPIDGTSRPGAAQLAQQAEDVLAKAEDQGALTTEKVAWVQVAILSDILSGEPRFLNQPEVAAALEKIGSSVAEVIEKSADGIQLSEDTLKVLQGLVPGFYEMISKGDMSGVAGMRAHLKKPETLDALTPALRQHMSTGTRWASYLPFIGGGIKSRAADTFLQQAVRKAGDHTGPGGMPGLPGALLRSGIGKGTAENKIYTALQEGLKTPAKGKYKPGMLASMSLSPRGRWAAQDMRVVKPENTQTKTAQLARSMLGNVAMPLMIADLASGKNKQAPPPPTVPPTPESQDLEVRGEDPASEEFIIKNRAKIEAALRKLDGKV